MEKKINLLFVDDEKKFLDNMTTRLRMREMNVTAFTSGMDAMSCLESGTRFDVALLDLKMPGMDGEELLKQLKEKDASIEVVILTGHGSIQSAANLTRSGAYEYLLKPCELDDVIKAITNAYTKRLKAKSEAHAKKVETIMERAIGMSPMEILSELRKID